jgi:S-adenosylmethionine synthetase
VACETLVTTGLVMVAGEITTKAVLDYSDIARDVVRDVGYTRAEYGFDAETCAVISSIKRQSPGHRHGRGYGRGGRSGLDVRFCLR